MTLEKWAELKVDGVVSDEEEVFRLVYFGGVQHDIRKEVWPYLLGHYKFGTTVEDRADLDEASRHYYETTMSEWLAVEAIVRQRDKEKTAHAVAKLSSESCSGDKTKSVDVDGEIENEVFEENDISDLSDAEGYDEDTQTHEERKGKKSKDDSSSKTEKAEKPPLSRDDTLKTPTSPKDFEVNSVEPVEEQAPVTNGLELNIEENCFGETLTPNEIPSNKSSPSTSSYVTVNNDLNEYEEATERRMEHHAVIITDASLDICTVTGLSEIEPILNEQSLTTVHEESQHASLDALQEPRSACVSPASSNGGIYSVSNLKIRNEFNENNFISVYHYFAE